MKIDGQQIQEVIARYKKKRAPTDIVGLDIAPEGIAAVRMRKTDSGISLLAAATLPPVELPALPEDGSQSDVPPMELPAQLKAKYACFTLTVAIGGLTETTEREEESKIPLLGDIPLIGKYLFSYSHTEKAQNETVIFVTVGIATPEAVGRESGLPEDTELARKKMIATDVKKKQLESEIQQLKEAAASEDAKSSKQKERLLRRIK